MCKVYKILPGRYFTFLKNHDNFKLKICGGKAEKQSPPRKRSPSSSALMHGPLACSRSPVFCAHILHLDEGHPPASVRMVPVRTRQETSITVNTSLPDSAVIPGMHSQCSTCQSMKLIRQGTCESKKAQVREGTSHSTRTYVLHLGVEHCTR